MTTVTDHGEERIKRLGLSKKLAGKITDDALKYGISHSDTVGSLKKYIDWLYFHDKTANNVRIYKQKVFIFNNENLITILNLPYRFHRTVENIKHKKKNEILPENYV